MNKKKNILYLACVLLLVSGNYGCSDYLEEVPISFIAPENFYQSENDALSSLYSIYDAEQSIYQGYFRDITLYLSDEGFSNKQEIRWSLNTYSYDERNNFIGDLWRFTYNAINRANATIDNVSLMDMDESKKNQIVGEARFLRALNYFNLVRFWGAVPLHLRETNSLDNIALEASSIEDIYQTILDDLSFAEQNMTIRKRGTADANGRADLAAVKMLLAKVYMTMAGYPVNDENKWQLALQKAKELYDMKEDFGFGLWDNYYDAFEPVNENGKEDIFSIQFKSGVGEGSQHHVLNFITTAGIRGNQLDRVAKKLVNMFDPDDERGFMPSIVVVNGVEYDKGTTAYFKKHTEQNIIDNNLPANDGDKNWPVFRYADLLLMCAEAENQVNGPTDFAYSCLNQVRSRSGAPEVSGLSREELLEFVLDERMRELSNEGSRYFDLVRYHILIEEVTEAHEIDPAWIPNIPSEKNYWLPYPREELNFNPNLQQRDGY